MLSDTSYVGIDMNYQELRDLFEVRGDYTHRRALLRRLGFQLEGAEHDPEFSTVGGFGKPGKYIIRQEGLELGFLPTREEEWRKERDALQARIQELESAFKAVVAIGSGKKWPA